MTTVKDSVVGKEEVLGLITGLYVADEGYILIIVLLD
jgi:hypothetical protein